MKGKEIINHIVHAEMPDMEQLRENCILEATKQTAVKRTVWVKRLVPVAACLVLVFAALFAYPQLTNNASDAPSLLDNSMRGLSVKNFSLADTKNGSTMDRMAFQSFGSLFEYGAEHFVVVKITDTHTQKGKSGGGFDRQVSEAYVLQSIYGKCETSTISITQSVIKDHFCLGTTNLLRKGGLYLLPLSQNDDTWNILGDMDVLFEIDDTGKVWSHSDFADFNRFDGKSIESMIDELQILFSNADFMLANSPFGGVLRSWSLADVTISDKSHEKTDKNGDSYYNFAFTVHEILSVPHSESTTPLGKTGSIKVYTDEVDAIQFLTGNRYLLCLDRYEGDIYVNSLMIAKIGNDETITAMPAPDTQSFMGASVFTPYDGYKLADIRAMVSRIKAWRDTEK